MDEIYRCPMCNNRLYKKIKGFICINHRCKLYFKSGKGWIFFGDKTKEDVIINSMWNNNRRLCVQHKWVGIKNLVLHRDNYECQFCKYNLADDWDRSLQLQVHHIVRSADNSAMYFDLDNLITACECCHDKLHKKKRRFD